jgi:hypothetical protein
MTDKSTDPAALWQTMLGEMEKGFNAIATQAMASPEFSKAMNQAGSVGAGAQKQVGDMMEKYLLSLNLPSRGQMVDFAGRLQTMEARLDEIKAMLQQSLATPGSPPGGTDPPRPPRTKRPPSPEGEQK